MKTAKRQSWQRFVTSINSRRSLKKVWNIVNKISGKRPAVTAKHLQDGDKEVTSLADIADTLAENFSEVSSSCHANLKTLAQSVLKFLKTCLPEINTDLAESGKASQWCLSVSPSVLSGIYSM